ncbi:DUF445 domain-containing protein [Novosphingobium sp. NDB2Meth1]|uniref:DUF445 domain-containing protein n=1 Tax=Novosphingobium sp. NDB2Meth1 TaxID=1892847 RepID=UPI000B1A76A8
MADPARRMRLFATALLLLMAALFLAARQLETQHAGWGFLRAFAEAAMVGGLADWFAVTALFRHPLGLPIPHTAIIPDNKDRIADSMAAFLKANFLTPPVVARRLRGLNAANAAGQYLANPRPGESRLGAGAASLIADVLESLDQEKLGGMAKAALRSRIERLALAPLLGNLLRAMIAEGRHMPLIEALIRRSAEALEANEDLVRRIIHDKANTIVRWTGLDGRLANGILDGLYKLLAETVVIADHPLRLKIEESLESLAEALVNDPAMHARVEAMKRDVMANPAFAAWLDGLWERGRAQLLGAVRSGGSGGGSDRIGASLAELGRALQHDARLQLLVNRFARRTLVGVATRHGGEIVRLVSETVRRWDARTVTDRIEGAVGRDLQFIRINGTLVGGLVGVAIHAVDVAL